MEENLTAGQVAIMLLKGVESKVAPFATGYFREFTSAADNRYACENVLLAIQRAIPVLEQLERDDQKIRCKSDIQGSIAFELGE